VSKSEIKSVDDYMASKSGHVAEVLEIVRGAILKALPNVEELISYKMPTYKLGDAVILHFAGWKHHYSLYPARSTLLAAFKGELAAYEVERGTIRFPLSASVPVKLIAAIAKFRAQEELSTN
jgi:uncharacterized protein YdhG (YjbR/CyaY superfamily)